MLVLEGVAKRYGETVALDGIDLALAAGTVHTVLGENGSGKSTLVKLLSGIVHPDRGTLRLDGRPVTLPDPSAARAKGIATVFQEVLVAPSRTLLDNVFLGHDGLVVRRLPRRERRDLAMRVLARFARTLPDLDRIAATAPLAHRQLVVLARALVRDPRILILDEVTAALEVTDRDVLFDALRRFVADGRLVVFISHRLDEVRRLSDRVTVLRSGRAVETLERDRVTADRLLQLMLPEARLRVHATHG